MSLFYMKGPQLYGYFHLSLCPHAGMGVNTLSRLSDIFKSAAENMPHTVKIAV
jgi:hypothetical protein